MIPTMISYHIIVKPNNNRKINKHYFSRSLVSCVLENYRKKKLKEVWFVLLLLQPHQQSPSVVMMRKDGG